MSGEAFVGVLACARAADATFPEAERSLLDLICRSHAFTRNLDPVRYRDIAASVKQRVAETGWESAMGEYLARLPDAWGYSTLLAVIDLCLIDADEDTSELTCIAWVADRFAIPLAEVNVFMQWFRIKNGMPGRPETASLPGDTTVDKHLDRIAR